MASSFPYAFRNSLKDKGLRYKVLNPPGKLCSCTGQDIITFSQGFLLMMPSARFYTRGSLPLFSKNSKVLLRESSLPLRKKSVSEKSGSENNLRKIPRSAGSLRSRRINGRNDWENFSTREVFPVCLAPYKRSPGFEVSVAH